MSEQQKSKYDGNRLAIRLQKPLTDEQKAANQKAEVIGEFSMFGRDIGKGLRSADPQTFEVAVDGKTEKKAKLVAFANEGDISVYQTNEYAKSKGVEKGAKVGVLFAREYDDAQGQKRIMLTGYFDTNGMGKDYKLSDAPMRAAASLFGPQAEAVLGGLLATSKARAEKAAARKAAAEGGAAPADAAPAAAEPEAPAAKPAALEF